MLAQCSVPSYWLLHHAFLRFTPLLGLECKIKGDDALSNVRSGLFKVTPTVEMKKEKKKRLNHRSGI